MKLLSFVHRLWSKHLGTFPMHCNSCRWEQGGGKNRSYFAPISFQLTLLRSKRFTVSWATICFNGLQFCLCLPSGKPGVTCSNPFLSITHSLLGLPGRGERGSIVSSHFVPGTCPQLLIPLSPLNDQWLACGVILFPPSLSWYSLRWYSCDEV